MFDLPEISIRVPARRRLECDDCDAEVREGDDRFEELWEAAQW